MNEELTYQFEGLIKKAIQEMLFRESCIESLKDKEISISKVVINNGNIIEVYLQIENELRQILNQQLNTIIENINKSSKNQSIGIQKITFNTNSTFRKIGWLRPINELDNFYELLDKSAVIGGIDYTRFSQHYFGHETPEKEIIWCEKDNRLVYFFKFLIDYNIIPPHDNPYLIICKNYCNENGENYDPKKLRKNYGNTMSSTNLNQFDYLIKPLKKMFNI